MILGLFLPVQRCPRVLKLGSFCNFGLRRADGAVGNLLRVAESSALGSGRSRATASSPGPPRAAPGRGQMSHWSVVIGKHAQGCGIFCACRLPLLRARDCPQLPTPVAAGSPLPAAGNLAGACRVPLLRARDCPQLLKTNPGRFAGVCFDATVRSAAIRPFSCS